MFKQLTFAAVLTIYSQVSAVKIQQNWPFFKEPNIPGPPGLPDFPQRPDDKIPSLPDFPPPTPEPDFPPLSEDPASDPVFGNLSDDPFTPAGLQDNPSLQKANVKA